MEEPTMRPTVEGGANRTDSEIFVDARAALDDRASIPAGVRVHVEGGVVTLTGPVQWPGESVEAERVVRAVPGVRRVVNDITIAHVASAEGFEAPGESS
jgi:osmotically-inducible protein OsmY